MAERKPVLYVFAISHYCEKARWALDYLGVPYVLRFVAPGEHGKIARRLGAPASSVPYLEVDGQVIQGSADIADWADNAAAEPAGRLNTDDANLVKCQEIEKRIDDIAGVHIRRFYYSEAIVEHPQTVKPIFTKSLLLPKKSC